MSDLTAIRELYRRFDAVFERPTTFYSADCRCVSKKAQRWLLETPRESMTDAGLAVPMNHYPGCFGTFRQMAYFMPRLVELFADSRDGLGCVMVPWSKLRRDREAYCRLGVWGSVVAAAEEMLQARTSTFAVEHYDAKACRDKGWGLDHEDLVVSGEVVHELLADFFFPELSLDPQATEVFADAWAQDSNPHRVIHLLDLLRWEWRGLLFDQVPPPLRERFASDEFILQVLDRVEPAIAEVGSPTWARDLYAAIDGRDQFLHND